MVSKGKYIRGIIISVLSTIVLIALGGFIVVRYTNVYDLIAQVSGQNSPTEKLESILLDLIEYLTKCSIILVNGKELRTEL